MGTPKPPSKVLHEALTDLATAQNDPAKYTELLEARARTVPGAADAAPGAAGAVPTAATAAAAAADAVRAAATAASEADQKGSKSRLNRINWILAIIGLVAAGAVLRWGLPWDDDKPLSRRAAGTSIPAAILVFFILALIRRGEGGLFAWVKGQDGRLSTSMTQVALWTVAFSSALLYFICRDFYSSARSDSFVRTVGEGLADLPEEYLLLLGGPFAAAVLARLIVGAKVESESVQKVESDVARPNDVVSNDSDHASLVDGQFLVFNLVALVWFVGAIIQNPGELPKMPSLLVALTSVSALGYVASKGAESNRPVIASVTLLRQSIDAMGGLGAAIRPGDLVEIRGAGFVPPGAEAEKLLYNIVVKFNGVQQTPTLVEGTTTGTWRSPSNNLIIAMVPLSVAPGTAKVIVVTAAGVETDEREFLLVEDKPVITGMVPIQIAPGEELTIQGRFFHRATQPLDKHPIVRFGGNPVVAKTSTATGLTVTVPGSLEEGIVSVTVTADGGIAASDPLNLRISKPAS